MAIRAMELAPRTALGVGLLAAVALVLGGCAAAPQMEPMVYAAQETPATAPAETTTQPATTESATVPIAGGAAAAGAAAGSSMAQPVSGGPLGEVVHERTYDPLPLRFSLTGSYMYAPVTGYAQIPSGGKVGTSSSKRPTFHQMGIDQINIGDGELGIGVGNYGEFFLGAQYIDDSGSSTIEHPLTTHGVTFPKGTNISGDLTLNWYRVGYRYPITIHNAAEGRPDLTFTPWIDAVFWDFSYSVDGGSAGSTSRSFTKPGAQLGGDLIWTPGGGPFSIEGTLASFPQISSMVQISIERVLFRYHFYQWRRYDFSAHIGVEWQQQDFKDNQRLSNHVSADFGPMGVVGLRVGF